MPNNTISFPDHKILQDFNNFVSRAKYLDSNSVRIQIEDNTLISYIPISYSSNILDTTPTVLAARSMLLSNHEGKIDITVPIESLLERFANMIDQTEIDNSSLALALPPTRLNFPWSGIIPPIKNWHLIGTQNILVTKNTVIETHAPFPKNIGPIFQKLAFLPEGKQTIKIYQNHKWYRFTTTYGHILVRII